MITVSLGFSGYSQSIDTISAPGAFPGRAQLDTVANVYKTSSANGSIAGINNNSWSGFAQLYTNFIQDSGWKITGCLSVWYGTISSSSFSVNFSVWNVDSSNAVAHPVSGLDSITGFPKGTPVTTQNVAFSTISSTINTTPGSTPTYNPTVTYTPFGTPAVVNRPFFLGYTFSSGYNWGTKGSQILSLGTTPLSTGGAITYYNNIHNNYYKFKTTGTGAHTMYLAYNAFFDGTVWKDYNWDDGDLVLLSIVPIVTANADEVKGITQNNLTFFGSYPNPATNNTNVKFSLATGTDVTLQIMDMSGRTINTISQNKLSTGEHIIPVQTANMQPGEYLYMIKTATGDAFASKLTVVK